MGRTNPLPEPIGPSVAIGIVDNLLANAINAFTNMHGDYFRVVIEALELYREVQVGRMEEPN